MKNTGNGTKVKVMVYIMHTWCLQMKIVYFTYHLFVAYRKKYN